MDGSNEQITNNQQSNRTVAQGDQALLSSGGTGGAQGGAAGPGGGPGGAAGAGLGTAGGSAGSAGPPISGQETGKFNPDISELLQSAQESFDNLTEEVLVASHLAIGSITSFMTTTALFKDFVERFLNEKAKRGTTCPICPRKK